MSKKVLILSVTAGSGHNVISASLIKELEKFDITCRVCDVFLPEFKHKAFMMDGFYIAMLRLFPHIARLSFPRIINRNPLKNKDTYIHKSVKKVMPKIEKIIEDYSPDAIVCAQIFAAGCISKMIDEGKIKVPTYFISTDFEVNPHSEIATNFDYITTSLPKIIPTLMNKGFKKEQILPLGIPTKICQKVDKKTALKALGLNDKFTALLFNIRAGFGSNLKYLKILLKKNLDINVICVNGDYKKMQNKIDKFIAKNNLESSVKNFGYRNDMPSIYDACDCIVTKGGGSTLAELLSKNLPMILHNNLSFNEHYNMKNLLEAKACLYAKKDKMIGEFVSEMTQNPKIIASLKVGMTEIAKPFAAKDIAYHINNSLL